MADGYKIIITILLIIILVGISIFAGLLIGEKLDDIEETKRQVAIDEAVEKAREERKANKDEEDKAKEEEKSENDDLEDVEEYLEEIEEEVSLEVFDELTEVEEFIVFYLINGTRRFVNQPSIRLLWGNVYENEEGFVAGLHLKVRAGNKVGGTVTEVLEVSPESIAYNGYENAIPVTHGEINIGLINRKISEYWEELGI